MLHDKLCQGIWAPCMEYFECDEGLKPQRIHEFISAFATPYILQFFEDNFSLTAEHKELEILPCNKFH